MWHEARKQEKKIRGMMVDYKRRAERRRDYYERIKQDPAQFLQVHGRPAKIHLDPAVATAADSPATMMPWQGHPNNLIDRFDVRAHLDIIPEPVVISEPQKAVTSEDRKACYERYRTLVQNDYMGVNEDKFLHQIFLEERFGPVLKPAGEEEKKRLMDKKAAIGYVYEDSTDYEVPALSALPGKTFEEDEDEDDEKDDLSDIDLDITVDVSELSPAQCVEMNELSLKYGMVDDDFITYLLQDKDEADHLRLVKEIEEEKAMFSGRKSRRERRALREKKLAGRKITSPPSYAARDSPTYTPVRHSTSKSRSRSWSPPNAGKIMFITSFGDEVSDGDKKLSDKTSKDKSSKSSKNSKEKSKTADAVIGPQLPEKSGSSSKSNHSSDSRRHANSSSSSSKRDHASSSSSKKYHSSRNRSRRSSSSSSSRSRSKRNRRRSRTRNSSRSRSRSSRSRSRSHKTSARSKSRSPPTKKSTSPNLPPPPVKSYYRHSLSRSSSNLSESDSPDGKGDSSSGRNTSLSLTTKLQQLSGKAGPSTKSKLTPQERLKRKMQLALNRQYKADKKAQMEKTEKQLQERMDRAEELRDMAIKLRQRERERRHKMRGYGGRDSDSDSSYLQGDYDQKDLSPRRTRNSSSSSSSSSSASSDRNKTRTETPKSSVRRSRSRSSSCNRSSQQDYKRTTYSRSEGRRSSPRRSPRRSPRISPSRSSSRRYDARRSPSRSPPQHSSYQSSGNRRDRHSRSPARPKTSRSPPVWLNSRSPTRWRGSRSPARLQRSRSPMRSQQSRSPVRSHSSRYRNSRALDY